MNQAGANHGPAAPRFATGEMGVRGSVRRCPLWVKSGHRNGLAECPLYPQKRTHAPSKSDLLFDRFSGGGGHC